MSPAAGLILAAALAWPNAGEVIPGGKAIGAAPPADPDTEAALADLAAAGQPLGQEEINALHAEAGEANGSGSLLVRWTIGPGLPVPTVRLTGSGAGLEGRVRWRRDPGPEHLVAGALAAAGARWRLGVGSWGLSHGFGLLLDRPGRGRSPGAGTSLAMPRRAPAPWTGGDAAQAVQGVLASAGSDGLGLRLLAGRRNGAGETTIAVQARTGGRGWRLAAAALHDPSEQGLSMALAAEGGGLTGSAEAALRRPAGGRAAVAQVIGHARWRPGHRITCELLSGWAQSGPGPVLGRRAEVAPAPGGRGWITRAAWRPQPGWTVALMARERWGATQPERGIRERDHLREVALTGRPADSWTLACRVRTDRTSRATWESRYPWLAPREEELRSRRLVVLQVGRQAPAWRWRVGWRQLREVRQQAAARGLWNLDGRLRLGPGWELRGGWTEAWGEPVDLVTAILPLQGLVLPRHWGRWRSGTRVGLRWHGRGWAVQAAAERRVPTIGGGEWRCWLEAGWSW